MVNNEDLKLFLDDMKVKLDSDEILDDELTMLGEFYMLCKFKKEYLLVKDKLEERDMIKFLVLGWYFYFIIQKKELGVGL